MPPQILPRRLPPRDQKQMIHEQTPRIRQREQTEHEHCKSHPFLRPPAQGGAEGDGVVGSVVAHVHQREGDEEEGEEGGEGYVGEEKPVVPAPHAVVEPDAVVVLCFDASVADATVVCAGRAPDGAGFAVFCRDLHSRRRRSSFQVGDCGAGDRFEGFNHNPLGRRRPHGEGIALLLRDRGVRVLVPWQHARIAERGVEEGGEGDVKHVGEDDRDRGGNVAPEVWRREGEEESCGEGCEEEGGDVEGFGAGVEAAAAEEEEGVAGGVFVVFAGAVWRGLEGWGWWEGFFI